MSNQRIAQLALVVNDYDEAIEFYTNKLNFRLIEDTHLPDENKRWVVVSPPGNSNTNLLLAQAKNERQKQAVGNQSGGRVFLFLYTDDFEADYQNLKDNKIEIVRQRTEHSYGTVCVFKDLYGNLWDLIQPID